MLVRKSNKTIIFTVAVYISLFSSASALTGEQIYNQNCMVCHGDDGGGAMPGVNDLAENNDFLALDNKTLIKRIINGIEKFAATVSMPPKGGNDDLNEKQIEAVIIYLKQLIKEGSK